jgi:cytidylate kinase
LLADPRLRDEAVSVAASVVAAIPGVRRALLDLQRNFAVRPPEPAKGAILDGRDIGSVVYPAAELKLFVTASAEERAQRRVEELRQQGAAAIFEDVLQDLRERDARDIERRAAPLSAAPDAIVIDTTTLDADAVFESVSSLIARAIALR